MQRPVRMDQCGWSQGQTELTVSFTNPSIGAATTVDSPHSPQNLELTEITAKHLTHTEEQSPWVWVAPSSWSGAFLRESVWLSGSAAFFRLLAPPPIAPSRGVD